MGVPAYPGCVRPSINTGTATSGKGESGAIMCAPAEGISKLMVLETPLSLASRIACRNEPGPESSTVDTTNTAERQRDAELKLPNTHKNIYRRFSCLALRPG